MTNEKSEKYVLRLREVGKKDVPVVGGKNASLGEMISRLSSKGVKVPGGFALTVDFYWRFIEENGIQEKLKKIFSDFDGESIKEVQKVGKKARKLFLEATFSKDLESEMYQAWKDLKKEYGNLAVAVRSSGVAEDAPTDSFAGQFETFLNVKGKEELLQAVKECLISSFNDRVISYREAKGISHLDFALSIGVQKMVRSDLACSGVMFTLDTETGFRGVVLINSVYGLGEMIVKGRVTPDEFYVFKPTLKKGYDSIIRKDLGSKNRKFIYKKKGGLEEKSVLVKDQQVFTLNDEEILMLARWAVIIEEHYNRPQDIEWAKDGKTGELFIVQSRPETVHAVKENVFYEEYKIKTKEAPIIKGIAIGDKIGQGKARIISNVKKISDFQKGEVLVTKMTDPDWVPAMRIASAIITDEGGKTAHAAIVAREFGVPCIVGTENASKLLKNREEVTVDCTQGLEGRVFRGRVDFSVKRYDLKKVPELGVKMMINIGAPEIAFKSSFLPVCGVGLAREEFIIAEKIRVHPLALYHYNHIKQAEIKRKIDKLTIEHKDKKEHFVKELAEGVGQIAAAFYPMEVILRLSDFKTNEYRNLVGGELFEGQESNPMLGFRGASRYLDKKFQPAFQMECEAIKRVRNIFGLKNISLMVPFCRTPEEGRNVLKLMRKFGLKKGKGLKVYVMCEIPSNVVLADEFLKIFDGMSIGTNDLTQLVLGLDRDNARIAPLFDERDPAVKKMVSEVIQACNAKNKYSGICGDAPSTFLDFAQFLIDSGIESISLSPDAVMKTILALGEKNSDTIKKSNL